MISDRFKSHLESIINATIIDITPVSGGDISQAYLVRSNQNYFLKCNTAQKAISFFKAEQVGLETIAKTNTIKTPFIHDCGQFDGHSYLFLEYILPKHPNSSGQLRRRVDEVNKQGAS